MERDAHKKEKEQLTVFDRKVAETARRVRLYMKLKQSLGLP